MKTVVLVLILGSLFVARPAHAALCFADQKVAKVDQGYVNGALGPDNGYAIYFTLESGKTYAMNASFNLDWARGEILASTLLTALVGGHRVTAYDHYAPYCDDVDELHLRK